MSQAKQASPNLDRERQAQVAYLEKRLAGLVALQEVAHTLTSELQLDRVLALILSSAMDVMKATAGSLLLYDAATQELVFQVVQGGGGKALRRKRIHCDEGIAGWVFTRCHPAVVQDVKSDPRFLARMDESLSFHTSALIAVPLVRKGSPIGVIELLNKKSGERFEEADQDLLMAFAAQSAVVIENARLYQQVVAERDRILAVEEEVRRELARELHDGPSQLLSALVMGIKFLREVIARAPERTEEELAQLERLSTQAMHQVRNMLFDLRPVALETQGLRAALQVYVERQQDANHVRLHLAASSLTARLPPKVEGALFSIVQEAVGNARKHADAQNIWIAAQQGEHTITLSVRDDGRGFDVATVDAAYAQRGNLGLLNMRERAEIARASLTIDSTPGEGTTVTLVLPLSDKPPRSFKVLS